MDRANDKAAMKASRGGRNSLRIDLMTGGNAVGGRSGLQI